MSMRRGISLVELILTLSACCVILTLSAGLIHRTMHAQTKARRVADAERSAWRLGQAFRRDVHAANQVLPDDGDLLVQFDLPSDSAVKYQHAAGRVERLLLASGAVQSRETFVFPAEVTITVTQPAPRVVALTIEPPQLILTEDSPTPAYSIPINLHAEAVLNRHPPFIEVDSSQGAKP